METISDELRTLELQVSAAWLDVLLVRQDLAAVGTAHTGPRLLSAAESASAARARKREQLTRTCTRALATYRDSYRAFRAALAREGLAE